MKTYEKIIKKGIYEKGTRQSKIELSFKFRAEEILFENILLTFP